MDAGHWIYLGGANSQRNRAFTLVEILVGILIIGLLIAIAAPSFLNHQRKAKDSGAKYKLAVAYRAAKSESVTNSLPNEGNFPAELSLKPLIESDEPELGAIDVISDKDTFLAADISVVDRIYIIAPVSDADDLMLAIKTDYGNIHRLTITNNGPPVYDMP